MKLLCKFVLKINVEIWNCYGHGPSCAWSIRLYYDTNHIKLEALAPSCEGKFGHKSLITLMPT